MNDLEKTTARGYGWQHQKARKAALAMFVPGQLCARCQGPIFATTDAELDHDDDDRTKYIGLSHTYCNRQHGGYKSTGAHHGKQTSACGFWDAQGRWNECSRDW